MAWEKLRARAMPLDRLAGRFISADSWEFAVGKLVQSLDWAVRRRRERAALDEIGIRLDRKQMSALVLQSPRADRPLSAPDSLGTAKGGESGHLIGRLVLYSKTKSHCSYLIISLTA
jgi:hypothetical protein